jgi:FAD/FMN-containing dehydrogenase
MSGLADDALAKDLAAAVRGEVAFDAGSRALYSTDASNYRQVPIGVVLPRSVDDVAAAMEVCASHGAAVMPRGGGTAMAGQSTNAAVVVDFSRHLNGVVSIDPGVPAGDVRRRPGRGASPPSPSPRHGRRGW